MLINLNLFFFYTKPTRSDPSQGQILDTASVPTGRKKRGIPGWTCGENIQQALGEPSLTKDLCSDIGQWRKRLEIGRQTL